MISDILNGDFSVWQFMWADPGGRIMIFSMLGLFAYILGRAWKA